MLQTPQDTQEEETHSPRNILPSKFKTRISCQGPLLPPNSMTTAACSTRNFHAEGQHKSGDIKLSKY